MVLILGGYTCRTILDETECRTLQHLSSTEKLDTQKAFLGIDEWFIMQTPQAKLGVFSVKEYDPNRIISKSDHVSYSSGLSLVSPGKVKSPYIPKAMAAPDGFLRFINSSNFFRLSSTSPFAFARISRKVTDITTSCFFRYYSKWRVGCKTTIFLYNTRASWDVSGYGPRHVPTTIN